MKQRIRYYKKQYSEVYGENGCLMVELDEELYCLRAIFINSEKEHTTNFAETNEFGLPEGSFKDMSNDFESITKEKFKQTWKTVLNKNTEIWEGIKVKLDKGDELIGAIKYFYPQGVIIDIGEKILGIANYQECEKLLGSKNLYPKTVLKVKITSFDEENMWIILSV